MNEMLLIFIGAGAGGVLRNAVNIAALRLFGLGFPIGTMFINVAGSFLIGVVAGWLTFKSGTGWAMHTKLFIITGVLGGFTTFSSFSLDTAFLIERGELGLAALYVGGSVGGALLAVFAGLGLIRALA